MNTTSHSPLDLLPRRPQGLASAAVQRSARALDRWLDRRVQLGSQRAEQAWAHSSVYSRYY